MLATHEDIIITRNGMEIAKLSALSDLTPANGTYTGMVLEKTKEYHCDGRQATYEEFLELNRDNEERYEYIDGEIYLLASPKTAHQKVLIELLGLF